MKRQARSTGRRGKPWSKTTGAHSVYDPRTDHAKRQARLKASVDAHFDAAALVQIVRDCQESGSPIPTWVPEALEWWLTEFVNYTKHRKGSGWTGWARKWLRTYLDAMIARHLVDMREEYGLTWDEAADATSDWYKGTAAAGSPDAMKAAYKRDRRRTHGRPETHWEVVVTRPLSLHVRPYRAEGWWAANADRVGSGHGEWLKRPRLLHTTRRK